MTTDAAPTQSARSMDQAVFRSVVGHFTSGVTVITTAIDGTLYGTTASAVSSLSLDPPMMLACLNRSSATHEAVIRAGRFAINILSAEQAELAHHFAQKGGDKFSAVAHVIGDSGVPLIDDALATIECTVAETAAGGTHTIFLGLVDDAHARKGEPLAYYRGRLGNLEQTQEAAAYAAMREWVLRRRTPLGQQVSIDAAASALTTDPAFVYNALVRLATEGLVSHTQDGGFTPTPISSSTVETLYDARATIESGVIAAYLPSAPAAELEAIAGRGRRLTEQTPVTSEDLDEFLEANLDFHCAIVGLAKSRQLVSHFRQLSVASLWRETYRAPHWRQKMGHPLVPLIADALLSRDVAGARELVHRQVTFIKDAAKHLINEQGGAL